MGNCMGRGTIISMVLVLGVLPSILVLGDSIIQKTKFKSKKAKDTDVVAENSALTTEKMADEGENKDE